MLIGVGTDLLKISRVPGDDAPEIQRAFEQKVYTDCELSQINGKKNSGRIRELALRFAGKEAVFKAISSVAVSFEPGEIEILDGAGGRPFVRLQGRTREKFEKLGGYAIFVSLSYDGDYALASAAAETTDR